MLVAPLYEYFDHGTYDELENLFVDPLLTVARPLIMSLLESSHCQGFSSQW